MTTFRELRWSTTPVVSRGPSLCSALDNVSDATCGMGELVDAGAPTVAATSRLDVAFESLTAGRAVVGTCPRRRPPGGRDTLDLRCREGLSPRAGCEPRSV